jgi:hypothetical protein
MASDVAFDVSIQKDSFYCILEELTLKRHNLTSLHPGQSEASFFSDYLRKVSRIRIPNQFLILSIDDSS